VRELARLPLGAAALDSDRVIAGKAGAARTTRLVAPLLTSAVGRRRLSGSNRPRLLLGAIGGAVGCGAGVCWVELRD